jgi:hypothetical protein
LIWLLMGGLIEIVISAAHLGVKNLAHSRGKSLFSLRALLLS